MLLRKDTLRSLSIVVLAAALGAGVGATAVVASTTVTELVAASLILGAGVGVLSLVGRIGSRSLARTTAWVGLLLPITVTQYKTPDEVRQTSGLSGVGISLEIGSLICLLIAVAVLPLDWRRMSVPEAWLTLYLT